jgi:hypothetical protein
VVACLPGISEVITYVSIKLYSRFFYRTNLHVTFNISGVAVSRGVDASFWTELDKCPSSWCLFRCPSLGQRQEILICNLVSAPVVFS